MPDRRILIFGGTGEARELAAALTTDGFSVVTSLAGVTAAPPAVPGETVRGGFGGTQGIAAYIARDNIAAVIDATHPFAARISEHARQAAADRDVPYLRFERPAWVAQAADHWIDVPDMALAVAAIPPAARVMLTVGRKEAEPFLARPDLAGVIRMIEEPAYAIPAGWTLIRARPPFALADEAALLETFRITVLVTKNAGGDQTYAKLLAARQAKIPVIMIRRPAKAGAADGSVAELISSLKSRLDT